jgi:hypothetical protein
MFPGSKGGRCVGLTTLPPSYVDCLKIWEPQTPGTLRACNGIALPLPYSKDARSNYQAGWPCLGDFRCSQWYWVYIFWNVKLCLWSGRFRRFEWIILLSYSELNCRSISKPYLLGLLDPEDDDNTILWNVWNYSSNDSESYSQKTWIFKVILQPLFLVLSQMHSVHIFVLYLLRMRFDTFCHLRLSFMFPDKHFIYIPDFSPAYSNTWPFDLPWLDVQVLMKTSPRTCWFLPLGTKCFLSTVFAYVPIILLKPLNAELNPICHLLALRL